MELERELVQKSICCTFTGCQKIVKFTIMTLSWMLLLPSASKALLNTLEVICACKILDILFWLGIFEHYQQTNVDDKLFSTYIWYFPNCYRSELFTVFRNSNFEIKDSIKNFII